METQRLTILFTRYLEQELNGDEYQELLQLLDLDNLDILDGPLKDSWQEALLQVPDQDAEKRIKLVLDKVDRNARGSFLRKLWWIPAAMLFLGAFALLYRSAVKQSTLTEKVQHFSTISTGAGQKKTVTLPDGSTVFLNSASSISYGEDYNHTERKISLKGEAFFKVEKDPAKPFIVKFKGLYTKVLGTSFNVNAYLENKGIEVAVSTGRVEVGKIQNIAVKGSSLAVLKAGSQLNYSTSDERMILSSVERRTIGDWKQGTLRFKGEDFGAVALGLEKWYGVKIRFDHPGLKNCRFRGTFKNLSLREVLVLLQKSSDFTFQINQQQVFIKGKGCL